MSPNRTKEHVARASLVRFDLIGALLVAHYT
jgi:hypothetical protein